MRMKEWRSSESEPVPEGVWVLGRYHNFMEGYTDPKPIFKSPVDKLYWVVSISDRDYAPIMERNDKPPKLWRFI
jgi:hypothetical protein